MSNRKIYQIGLIAAIIATLSWFIYVFAQISTPSTSTIADPQQFFLAIEEARMAFLLYGWSGVWGVLLGLPYLYAFYRAIAGREGLVQLALIFVLLGSALALLGFFKPLTLVYEYLPMALAADQQTLPIVKTAAAASLEILELPWNLGSFLLFGLGTGMVAFFGWREAVGPRWINVIGLIGGICGIVWLQAYIPILVPVATVLILTNILAISIWAIGLSTALVRAPANHGTEAEIDRALPTSV